MLTIQIPVVRKYGSHIYRSKLNTKCGRSPRFGRPSRSGDTGCWQNSLVAWRLRCLSRPGAHTSHHHEPAVNWSMAGGTCHPINKSHEIAAALLENSCATASSPVYLNWSAPHMSSHTSWKIMSSTLNEDILESRQWIHYPAGGQLFENIVILQNQGSVQNFKVDENIWQHRDCTISSIDCIENCVISGAGVNIRYYQIWKVCQIWETFHIWCWAPTWFTAITVASRGDCPFVALRSTDMTTVRRVWHGLHRGLKML